MLRQTFNTIVQMKCFRSYPMQPLPNAKRNTVFGIGRAAPDQRASSIQTMTSGERFTR